MNKLEIQSLRNTALAAQADEREYFDPAAIQIALDRNIVTGLRMLADAIEAGKMDGRCIDVQGCGLLGKGSDIKSHVMIRLDIAAEVYKTVPFTPRQLVQEKA